MAKTHIAFGKVS